MPRTKPPLPGGAPLSARNVLIALAATVAVLLVLQGGVPDGLSGRVLSLEPMPREGAVYEAVLDANATRARVPALAEALDEALRDGHAGVGGRAMGSAAKYLRDEALAQGTPEEALLHGLPSPVRWRGEAIGVSYATV